MYGKATTIVSPGHTSVRLKRYTVGAYDFDKLENHPMFRYRILCGVDPNCMGELAARKMDRVDNYLRQGGLLIQEGPDGHFAVRDVYFPPVYVVRDGVIEHIKRSRPRSPSMHSEDARNFRMRVSGSLLEPSGYLWPEFTDIIMNMDGRRASVSQTIGGGLRHMSLHECCPSRRQAFILHSPAFRFARGERAHGRTRRARRQ